ncbi:MAG: hypothetical protein M3Z25_08680 [Actinomycetota bacterium]|nr:hypothetical protein [Actinomycetota bacterium]
MTSIEIDAALAATARDTLQRWGYPSVTVITGDGAEGAEWGSRFDRVIVTVGTREIPWSWVEQTRVGGRIVAPLNGD